MSDTGPVDILTIRASEDPAGVRVRSDEGPAALQDAADVMVDGTDGVRELLKPFCLDLVRALLHHSYYPPDHPQARQVSAQPFSLLKELGRRWPEFTFARASLDDDGGGMMLQGIYPEPVELDWVIAGTAGATFASGTGSSASR